MAWVGIGCGGFIVIGLIASAFLFSWAKDKVGGFVDDLKASPERMAARAVVEMHPELELVSEDEESGEMTVRFTQSGEEATVSYGEIAEGRLSFTAPDGSVVELGQGKLEDMPTWVPRYPGATNEMLVYQRVDGTKKQGLLTFSTTDDPAMVGDYCKAQMENLGASSTSSQSNVTIGNTTRVTRKISGSGKSIDLTATADRGATNVQILFEER